MSRETLVIWRLWSRCWSTACVKNASCSHHASRPPHAHAYRSAPCHPHPLTQSLGILRNKRENALLAGGRCGTPQYCQDNRYEGINHYNNWISTAKTWNLKRSRRICFVSKTLLQGRSPSKRLSEGCGDIGWLVQVFSASHSPRCGTIRGVARRCPTVHANTPTNCHMPRPAPRLVLASRRASQAHRLFSSENLGAPSGTGGGW
jgi:hypothetical protein